MNDRMELSHNLHLLVRRLDLCNRNYTEACKLESSINIYMIHIKGVACYFLGAML